MNKYKLIFLSVLIFFFGSIFFYGIILSMNVNCEHLSTTITIEKGYSVNDVSRILENNLCISSTLFKIAIKMTFNESNIRHGSYDLKSAINVRDLISILTSMSSDRVRITIFEGMRLQEIALRLTKKMNFNVEKFVAACYDKDFIESLGLFNVNTLEGYLFPDTYIFLKTYTEKDVIKVMVKQFIYNYNEHVEKKSNYSMQDIVTLASIIQGEAMYVDEMKTISSVYHNRLKKNMLLQADPTIQYILPKHKKRVLYNDTQIENPYNTYLYKGLPPGPINSPGIDAIIAANNPDNTSYLYFVSNGKGRHIFNRTYRGHLNSK